MGKNLLAPIILGFLSLTCLTAGSIGFVQSKNSSSTKEKEEYKIKYNYYVDDEEVDALPINEDALVTDYVFNRYSCTNKVTGQWNEELWSFEPVLTNNATCKLYFNRAYYNVDFEIEYGELRNSDGSPLTEEQKEDGPTVEREKDLIAKIVPDEGYTLVSVECDGENLTNWDKENNELTVKNVKADTVCKVKFELSSYEIKINVENGEGATSLNSKHGDAVNTMVVPNSNYGNANVQCTNNQIASWTDNKFTIAKITSNTECKVTFSLLTYDINLNIEGGTADNQYHDVLIGSTKEINITPNSGYSVEYTSENCSANISIRKGESSLKLTASNITSDISCTIKFNKLPDTPKPETSTTQQ